MLKLDRDSLDGMERKHLILAIGFKNNHRNDSNFRRYDDTRLKDIIVDRYYEEDVNPEIVSDWLFAKSYPMTSKKKFSYKDIDDINDVETSSCLGFFAIDGDDPNFKERITNIIIFNGLFQTSDFSVRSNKIYRGSTPMTAKDVMTSFQEDVNFNFWWIDYLSSFEKPYFFECAPVTESNFDTKEFKFEIIESEELSHRYWTNLEDFSEYIKKTNKIKTASFLNLRKDTTLLIPQPLKGIDINSYSQLYTFMKDAPLRQKIDFWKDVGQQFENSLLSGSSGSSSSKLSKKPLYMSTHGLGVSYIHIRFANKPKYYQGKYGN